MSCSAARVACKGRVFVFFVSSFLSVECLSKCFDAQWIAGLLFSSIKMLLHFLNLDVSSFENASAKLL